MAAPKDRSSNRCHVCRHPERIRIEALHVGGVTLDALQAEFGVQRDAIHRHCKFHVTRIAKINYLAGPVQIATLAQAAARENKSILEYLSVIRSILMNQLVRNAEKGNARTAGQISGYLTTVLQTLGKITGEISALASTTLTGKFSPTEWATRAVAAYKRHEADRIVAEANQGGAMVETTLRAVDRSIPVRLVHASRGKITRAEPVSALYEQNRVHHLGCFPELEDELCSFEPGSTDSPDRLDALVWGLTDLMLGGYQEITSFHVPVVASRPRGNFDAPFVSAADGAYSDTSMPPGGWPAGSPGADPFAYLNWSPKPQ